MEPSGPVQTYTRNALPFTSCETHVLSLGLELINLHHGLFRRALRNRAIEE
jgi:hypothetical protein